MTMSDAAPKRKIGDVVNGRFLIQRLLGTGAMGQVFLAHDGIRKAQVAMKYLLWRPNRTATLEYFKSEFSTLTRLHHPYVTQVFDFAEDDAVGSFFFASEYVNGEDFFTAARRFSPLEAVVLLGKTLQALAYLHDNHVYHFDIKPQNILVSYPDDRHDAAMAVIKLIDFGLAGVRGENRTVGTPSYMAPEMIQRDWPDHRADLYSLGVLLYGILTGENPFRTADREATFQRQLTFTPPPPSSRNPMIPHFLDDIVLGLLAKRREERFASADEVLRLLRKHVDIADLATAPTTQLATPWEGRFVGREDALAEASTCLDACLAGNAQRAPVLWIRGGSGTGKSRVLREIKFKAQLAGFATHTLDHADITSRLAWLAAIDAAREDPGSPVLFLLDDITTQITHHFTDDVVRGLCDVIRILRAQLHLSSPAQPLRLLVAIASPDTAEAAHIIESDLRIPVAELQVITLENFSPRDVASFLNISVGLDMPSPELIATLHQQTGGNPLALAMAAARLPVGAEPPPVTPAEPSAPPQDDTAVLEALAVWETPVTVDRLQQVLGALPQRNVFTNLEQQGIIQYDPVHYEYRFRNRSTRTALYKKIAPAHRQALHDRVAGILLHEPDGVPERIFFHQGRGAHPDALPRALWELATRQIGTRPREALDTLTQLLAEADFPDDSAARIEILFLMAEQAVALRQFRGAERIYDTLRRLLADDATRSLHLARVYEAFGNLAFSQHEWDIAESAVTHALGILAEFANDPVPELRLDNVLGQIALARGEVRQACEIFERTHRMSARLPVPDRKRIANNALALVYLAAGEPAMAESQWLEDIAHATALQQWERLVRAQYYLARALGERQDPTASALLKTAMALAVQHQCLGEIARCAATMGHWHVLAGHHPEAIASYRTAREYADRVGDPLLAAQIAIDTGLALMRMQDGATAEPSFLEALGLLDTNRELVLAVTGTLRHTAHEQLAALYVTSAAPERAIYHANKAHALVVYRNTLLGERTEATGSEWRGGTITQPSAE